MPGEQTPVPSFLLNQLSEEPEADTLDKLSSLVTSYEEAELDVEELEEKLKAAKAKALQLGRESIPQLLLQHNLSRIKLANGKEVNIKEDVSVSVKDQDRFMKFLADRQEDAIAKLHFDFDRMESDMREKLMEFLDVNHYPYEADYAVHPSTLKKYFRDLLGVGMEADERKEAMALGLCLTPSDPLIAQFGTVFTFHQTKVKEPKKRKL